MQQNGHKDLIVWQKAMDLVVELYLLLPQFPKEEVFGLSAQMKRAAVSIPSNIAEGYHRASPKDRKHFFVIAFGSAAELETQIEIAKRLHYLNGNECDKVDALLNEVLRILNKMTKSD